MPTSPVTRLFEGALRIATSSASSRTFVGASVSLVVVRLLGVVVALGGLITTGCGPPI